MSARHDTDYFRNFRLKQIASCPTCLIRYPQSRYAVVSEAKGHSIPLLRVHKPKERTTTLRAYFHTGLVAGYVRCVFNSHSCKPCLIVNYACPRIKARAVKRDDSSTIR